MTTRQATASTRHRAAPHVLARGAGGTTPAAGQLTGHAPIIEVAPARRRALDAARQRRARRRQREGTRPVTIEVDLGRAVLAIETRDGLSELQAESLDWPAVEREVAAVWGEFIRAWGRR
jgi:hypothetical protein